LGLHGSGGSREEAEVVAARLGASKMAFLEQLPNMPGTGYSGDSAGKNGKYMDVEPGSIEQLPYGYTMKPFDPTHPNSAYKEFIKACLRGISSGLGVSYTSLANDLEGVNYSSIRAGLIEERQEWLTLQSWFISWFITPIFEEWLKSALATGAITDGKVTLPANRFDKFNMPEWKPRRWDWVDPLKDMQAAVLAVEKGFKSRRSIIAENGGDIEDVFNDIAADEKLAEEHDLDFSQDSGEQANVQQSKPDEPDSVDKPTKVE
jgi:lambda family phage portal protein